MGAGKMKVEMYPMHEIKIGRYRSAELSANADDHPPIDEPVREPPTNDPPSIKRPPKKDPSEPAELPLQDPNPRRPRRSHPGNSADRSNELERL